MRHVARSLAVVLCLATCAAAAPHTFQGRSLDEALRLLQQDGLPIVYSTEIVTPSMRVNSEPHARTPRQQLDELLHDRRCNRHVVQALIMRELQGRP